ncbi:hypothetical protein GF312_13695 [Candidatus Poribacteria bacterium]|nr:hypothetical protein [Candidatus Poribacteria bacterium]
MLVSKFKSNLGKSSRGGQSLYDHIMTCVRVAHRILGDTHFISEDYPRPKRDQLLFSVFIHDLGKLDPDFQAMLKAARDSQPFPSKRVKHEASTLDYSKLLTKAEDEVREHLYKELNYKFSNPISLEDTMAFAVSHHGLFYLSFETRDGQVLERVRREWTVFNHLETRRITLTDLLFDYHPLGGIVIIADLLGSFCYEQGITDLNEIIQSAATLRELINIILKEGIVEVVEENDVDYYRQNYGLRNLMAVLSGGLA